MQLALNYNGPAARSKCFRQVTINLFGSKFDLQPDVAMQPLLIMLRQVDLAQQLTANARQLRQSSNTYVVEHVYVNPNLTRAKAAYHARQQRRQLAQDRVNRQREQSDEQAA